jgi:hypothetical protein
MATETEAKTYNGWKNYETWVVKLWMDNDEGSYKYWESRTKEMFDEAKDAPRSFPNQTQKQYAAYWLAEALKDEHEENLPELTGFAADLLGAAMSEVNWYEIAESLLDEFPDNATTEEQEGQ